MGSRCKSCCSTGALSMNKRVMAGTSVATLEPSSINFPIFSIAVSLCRSSAASATSCFNSVEIGSAPVSKSQVLKARPRLPLRCIRCRTTGQCRCPTVGSAWSSPGSFGRQLRMWRRRSGAYRPWRRATASQPGVDVEVAGGAAPGGVRGDDGGDAGPACFAEDFGIEAVAAA